MTAIDFKESNRVYGAAQPEYLGLPAHYFTDKPGEGRIACCWKLTWKERWKVLRHGVIWQQILTFNKQLQPQLLDVEKPDMSQRIAIVMNP